jgi:excinuclease ABC subunit C
MSKPENREKFLQDIIIILPHSPGVYQYFNAEGTIIYIGKAKDLRKRVSSYFSRDAYENRKLMILVSKIRDIRYIVVDSESDALLLENNLIKKYQPRYNILLKDDKTFPWLAIKKEHFPRIIYTRNYVNDGSEYFGPYTSGLMVKTLLDLVKRLYPLRTCSLDLSAEKIAANKYKPCLEFHVGNCKAPCIGKQEEQDYIQNIENIRLIFKGNLNEIKQYLSKLMQTYATDLQYESAQLIKEKIDIISNYQNKSTIVNPSINNVDVFSIIEKEDDVCVNFLRVASGAVIQVHSVVMKRKLDESEDEILSIAMIDIRQRMFSNSSEIIVPFVPEVELSGVKYVVPKQGDKLKLLELSQRNARMFLNEKLLMTSLKSERITAGKEAILEKLKIELRLEKIPFHIECFDNSNLQGTNPVAACVVFKHGKPAVKEYRHFNVKTVVGPDDFASMREIVTRRYKRLLEENQKLPNLIVVDGGKGQLSAAVEVLNELGLSDTIEIIGIAKRLEEIFKPGDPVPLYIDKNSSSLKIIQHLRDEAHRFGITFHRNKRSKNFMLSELNEIVGIGEKTRNDLLSHFKSIDKIKSASFESLVEIVGKSRAEKIRIYFENKDNS